MIESLAQNWAFHLAHALWQTTLAAAAVLVLLRMMRNSSPRLRHALATIAFVKFVLPPMLPLPTGAFSAAPPVPELTSIRDAVHALDPRIALALMLLHAIGVAIVLTRLGIECRTLHGIRRRAVAADGYLLSDEIAVPLTTGIFRPAILIPSALVRSLSPAELRDVLAHEAQHVRNGDVRAGALQSLVVALKVLTEEQQRNRDGYMLLNHGKFAEAIAMFKVNTEKFPRSSNVWDSLGEAYMKAGEKALAVASYRKSLELNPKNTNAEEMMKKLLSE